MPAHASHSRTGHPPPAVVIDGIFRALSDPTRRDVVARLSAKPASVSELAAPYKMAMLFFENYKRKKIQVFASIYRLKIFLR